MSNLSRTKPYTTNQQTWRNILSKSFSIPMSQRKFEWTSTEIKPVLDDIIKIYEEGKYVEKMGSIINLSYDNNNSIYDGQQRTLTIVQILYCLGSLVPTKLRQKAIQLLALDDLDTLTSEQKKIKKEMNVTTIPKIFCVNPDDRKAIVELYNDKIELYTNYIDNFNNIYNNDIIDDDECIKCSKYICKQCKTEVKTKSNFIRHIQNQHGYKQLDTNSNIYNSFEYISIYLQKLNYTDDKIIGLWKFILDDIDIQFYDCNDPEYVSSIFDWENNRGKNVEKLDIIKNHILINIPDDKKLEVYEKWEIIKSIKNNIYDNFGEKLLDIGIQVYNNVVERTPNKEKLFKKIVNAENTYLKLQELFNIIDEFNIIYSHITNDKDGRLITNVKYVSLNWEAYMWCLLPIFYIRKSIDSELIKLFTKWHFRNVGFKTRTFNNLCYSNGFIAITNKYLQNSSYDYMKDIKQLLITNSDILISNENYINNFQSLQFKSTNILHLLLFLETRINTDIHNVPLNYTLEHIYPQKNKDSLIEVSVDNIGNITLLEGKNSENGHKGNSSIGAKDFDIKLKTYKGSNSKLTRQICEKYTKFDETDIISRNKEIAILLNNYTNYF